MTDNERVVRYTAEEIDEMLARGEDMTDWERVRNMTDEEVDATIDHEEEGEFDWDAAYVGTPRPLTKKQLTIRLDDDIVTWFKEQGPGYQTRMNQVLRSYVDVQRKKADQDRGDRKVS